MSVITLQKQGYVRARNPQGLDSPTLLTRVIGAVAQVATVTHDLECTPHRPLLVQRHVDGAFRLDRGVVACFDIRGCGRVVEAWTIRNDVDCATVRIAAVEGSLRAFQHFAACD